MLKIQDIFIDNLKRVRKEKGFSQAKLAEKCNLSSSYFGEIEMKRRSPSLESIQKIIEALNIEPYELFIDHKNLINFDRDALLKSLNTELRTIIIEDINNTIQKYK